MWRRFETGFFHARYVYASHQLIASIFFSSSLFQKIHVSCASAGDRQITTPGRNSAAFTSCISAKSGQYLPSDT